MNIRAIYQGPLGHLTADQLRDLAAAFQVAADNELIRIQQARLEAIRRERKLAAEAQR